MKSNAIHLRAWFIWGLAACFFFGHYTVRVAPSVMIGELMQAFSVGAVAIGSLAAFFYVSYVACQIPMGILIDKFGPRLILGITVSLCGLSAILFAHSSSIEAAQLSRFMLGIASAAAFVGSLKLATAWFPPKILALTVGITQALGMVGAMFASFYVPVMVQSHGWRESMAYLGWGLILLAISITFFVRNQPNYPVHHTHGLEGEGEQVPFRQYLSNVLLHVPTWSASLFCGLLFVPTQILGETWGVKYLETAYQISPVAAGSVIGFIFLGWVIGGPLTGVLANLWGRRTMMRIGAIGSCLFIYPILFWSDLNLTQLSILIFALGLCNSTLVASYTLVGELHHVSAAGLALAIANMMTVLVGAALQILIGKLLEANWDHTMLNGIPVYQAQDFQTAMFLIPVSLGAALLCTFFVPETLEKSED